MGFSEESSSPWILVRECFKLAANIPLFAFKPPWILIWSILSRHYLFKIFGNGIEILHEKGLKFSQFHVNHHDIRVDWYDVDIHSVHKILLHVTLVWISWRFWTFSTLKSSIITTLLWLSRRSQSLISNCCTRYYKDSVSVMAFPRLHHIIVSAMSWSRIEYHNIALNFNFLVSFAYVLHVFVSNASFCFQPFIIALPTKMEHEEGYNVLIYFYTCKCKRYE